MPDINTVEQQIETAIAIQETSNGTAGVGSSLNNPGAIRYAPWETYYGASESTSGKTAQDAGFASFPSLQQGFDALMARVKQLVGVPNASITSVLNKYAPERDANGVVINPTTPARIASIAQATGLDPTKPITAQTTGTDATGGQLANVLLGSINNGGGVTGQKTEPPTWSWSRVVSGVAGCVFIIIGLIAVALVGANQGLTVAANAAGTMNEKLNKAGAIGKTIARAGKFV